MSLILTRRVGETIVIGEAIRVTVLEIHAQQVRLGIAAPREVAVDREEVFQRKALEPKAAPRSPTLHISRRDSEA